MASPTTEIANMTISQLLDATEWLKLEIEVMGLTAERDGLRSLGKAWAKTIGDA